MGPFVFVNGAALKVAPGTKVLKAGAYSDYVAAGDVLGQAAERAAGIAARAEEAFRQEQARGYAEGLREGKAAASRLLIDTVSRSARYLEENEGRIITIVSASLRKLLGEAGETEKVAAVVRGALSIIGRQEQVTVRVPPGREADFGEEIRRLLPAYPRIRVFEVVPDSDLKGSQCILETKAGKVEASLETQLEAIAQALEGVRAGSAGELRRELRAMERDLLESLRVAP